MAEGYAVAVIGVNIADDAVFGQIDVDDLRIGFAHMFRNIGEVCRPSLLQDEHDVDRVEVLGERLKEQGDFLRDIMTVELGQAL